MNFPPLLPIRIRKSKVCDRCGLWYPREEACCTHCHGLDEAQVRQLVEDHALQHPANANLGRLFMTLAVVLALIVLVILATSVLP